MKIVALLFTILIQQAHAQNLMVLDVNGQAFEATREEVLNSFSAISDRNYSERFLNDDGSVTFSEPKFMHAGVLYPVSYNKYKRYGLSGLCRFLGFRTYIQATSVGYSYDFIMAVRLKADGSFWRKNRFYDVNVVKEVTCK